MVARDLRALWNSECFRQLCFRSLIRRFTYWLVDTESWAIRLTSLSSVVESYRGQQGQRMKQGEIQYNVIPWGLRHIRTEACTIAAGSLRTNVALALPELGADFGENFQQRRHRKTSLVSELCLELLLPLHDWGRSRPMSCFQRLTIANTIFISQGPPATSSVIVISILLLMYPPCEKSLTLSNFPRLVFGILRRRRTRIIRYFHPLAGLDVMQVWSNQCYSTFLSITLRMTWNGTLKSDSYTCLSTLWDVSN